MLTVLVLSVLDGKYREPLLPREIPLSPLNEFNELIVGLFFGALKRLAFKIKEISS